MLHSNVVVQAARLCFGFIFLPSVVCFFCFFVCIHSISFAVKVPLIFTLVSVAMFSSSPRFFVTCFCLDFSSKAFCYHQFNECEFPKLTVFQGFTTFLSGLFRFLIRFLPGTNKFASSMLSNLIRYKTCFKKAFLARSIFISGVFSSNCFVAIPCNEASLSFKRQSF